jgi:hypothetical protein
LAFKRKKSWASGVNVSFPQLAEQNLILNLSATIFAMPKALIEIPSFSPISSPSISLMDGVREKYITKLGFEK